MDNDLLEEIDFDFYKVLYIVKKNGSFSKAAEELNTTQPAVSYKIKKLEEKLGIKLFIRDTRPLQLTSEAKVIMPYIENAVKGIQMGIRKLEEFSKIEIGEIILGVPSHISIFLLTDKIKSFNKDHPKIKIKLVSKPTKELFEMLKNNELDLIIDSSPFENINNFKIQKISREKCVFACNKAQNQLLNKKYDLKSLNEQPIPIIVPSVSSSNTRELKKVYKRCQVDFNPLYEVTTSEMIVEMIRQNIGIGYLFEKMVEKYEYMQKIQIDNELPAFDIYVITKDERLSKTCECFLEYIIKNNKKKHSNI